MVFTFGPERCSASFRNAVQKARNPHLHRRIVRVAEEASDDAAVAATGDRACYAATLLDFMQRGVRGESLQGVAMARYGLPEERINRILDGKAVSRGVTKWSVAAILALGSPLAYFVAAAAPQSTYQGQVVPNTSQLRPSASAVAAPVLLAQTAAPPATPAQPSKPQQRTAYGQSSSTPPNFEVASVKLTAHGRNAEGWSFSDVKIASPGRLVGINASLDECIRWAYDIKEYQISGPNWLNSDAASYDIEAKAPPDTTPKQMRLMLQTLLRERFKLALHRDTRMLPVYLLTVAKNGPRLESAAVTGGGLWAEGGPAGVRVAGDSATMEALAHRLSLDLERPVFDKTGIQGRYRIKLEWAREGEGPSIFAALQEQLGLRLEAGKAPIEILVIDHAERIPTEN